MAWPLPSLGLLSRKMGMETEQAQRGYGTVSLSPSHGIGAQVSCLLPCWQGPSCPSYLREAVLGQTVRAQ